MIQYPGLEGKLITDIFVLRSGRLLILTRDGEVFFHYHRDQQQSIVKFDLPEKVIAVGQFIALSETGRGYDLTVSGSIKQLSTSFTTVGINVEWIWHFTPSISSSLLGSYFYSANKRPSDSDLFVNRASSDTPILTGYPKGVVDNNFQVITYGPQPDSGKIQVFLPNTIQVCLDGDTTLIRTLS